MLALVRRVLLHGLRDDRVAVPLLLPAPQMLRPRRAVIIFLVLLAFGYGGWLRASVTVAEVDARLKNRLPAGVHHTRVAAVLDSLKVERSEYDQEARKIYAVWRRTRVELFSEYGIEGRFSFDDRGALVDYELEETFTAW